MEFITVTKSRKYRLTGFSAQLVSKGWSPPTNSELALPLPEVCSEDGGHQDHARNHRPGTQLVLNKCLPGSYGGAMLSDWQAV